MQQNIVFINIVMEVKHQILYSREVFCFFLSSMAL